MLHQKIPALNKKMLTLEVVCSNGWRVSLRHDLLRACMGRRLEKNYSFCRSDCEPCFLRQNLI